MINNKLSEKANNLKLGRYRHCKGADVIVLGVANHSETLEELVTYRHLEDDKNHFWIRPIEMFLENVTVDGKQTPRFEYLGE